MTPNGNDSTAIPAAASGCPVLVRGGVTAEVSTTKPGVWSRWFGRSTSATDAPPTTAITPASSMSECPVKGVSSISECPVKGNKSIPASIEEAAKHSQVPAPGQRIPLSTSRVISSIPRGEADDAEAAAPSTDNPTNNKTSVPAHQPSNSHKWQYPSEQQFYNAMLKKGYRPPVEAIPDTLRIHNAVNERSWRQVCKWEKDLHDNADPKLVKFVGKPKDLSPKAWWNSRVLMMQEPFDRHDWYVEDNGGGEEPRRYVIDFYEGKESSQIIPGTAGNGANGKGMPLMKPPSMYIDARPALDNPSAALDRMAMAARETLPGIASAWDSYKSSASSAPSAGVAGMEGGTDKGGSGN